MKRGGRSRIYGSCSTRDANADFVHSGRFLRIVLGSLFGIRCTAVRIGLSSGNDNRLGRRAHNSCLVRQTPSCIQSR